MWYRFLADVIVVVHFGYVAFVVGGMLLILIGVARRWGWVRNFWFRVLHFLAIALVAAESLFGVVCPLTEWENSLRGAAGDPGEPGSFIGQWIHRLMFFEVPESVFTIVYILFGTAVLATLLWAPPRLPWKKAAGKPQ